VRRRWTSDSFPDGRSPPRACLHRSGNF
jgi:hypothetical protein